MKPIYFLFLILTATMLFEAFYVWWKNPKNPINYLFGLSMLFLSFWPLAFVIILNTNNYRLASFVDNSVYAFFMLFIIFFIPLSVLFPSNKTFTPKQRTLVIIFTVISFALTIASYLDLISGPLSPNWKVVGPTRGPLAGPFLIYGLATIIIALYFFISKYRHSNEVEKRQITFTLSGLIITIISAFILGGVFSLLLGIREVAILGPFSIIFLITFIAWAILKHHLFDIRVLASEIFAYILILFSLFPLFGSYIDFPTFIGRAIFAVLGTIISLLFVRATINEKTKTKEILDLNQLIAAQNSRNEALLESINDGVFAVDLERKIILFNKRAEALSGYRRDEVLGKKYFEFIHFLNEKTGEEQIDFIETVIESGAPAKLGKNIVLRQKNNHLLPVGDSASPVRDQSSKTIGAIIVFRDVEEERRVEQMKDEFINIAAHELRDPMTAMKGFVSILQDGDLGKISKTQKGVLKMITDATERLLKLVTDMLNTARLDAGKIRFELEKFPLGPVVQEIMQFYTGEAKKKRLKFNFVKGEVNAYKTQIIMDKDKVFQALSNIISNAIKFTAKGSITVSLKKDGNFIVCTVSDTGPGIPEEQQRHLFEKFSRGKNIERTGLLGSGLGLYIAKKMIEKMGGNLWLESSGLDKGSVFALSLPILGTPEQEKAAEILTAEIKSAKSLIKPE